MKGSNAGSMVLGVRGTDYMDMEVCFVDFSNNGFRRVLRTPNMLIKLKYLLPTLHMSE